MNELETTMEHLLGLLKTDKALKQTIEALKTELSYRQQDKNVTANHMQKVIESLILMINSKEKIKKEQGGSTK